MTYTLEDLEQARAELRAHSDRFDRYSGNNPNKYRSDIDMAMMKVESITTSLKASGVLPKSEQELLEERIDAAFPKARSKDIVDFEGRKYQLRYWPKRKSRSGKTVQEWDRWWELLAE